MKHKTKNELITEGQELIARFMGWKQSDGNDGVFHKGTWYDDDMEHYPSLHFESNWDWLMPCIKKISDELSYDWYMDNIVTHMLDNNIERAFGISVDAIKTHNESVGGN